MENVITRINNSGWEDWVLKKIEMDFDKIKIFVAYDEKTQVVITCKDFIGFQVIGHWDESTIEEIKIDSQGHLIEESIQMVKNLYGENPIPGGGIKNIYDNWVQLNLQFTDGIYVKIACKEIEAE
ncbi:MAG: hypothetical protein ACOY4Q_05510 [Bacillota bacterium]